MATKAELEVTIKELKTTVKNLTQTVKRRETKIELLKDNNTEIITLQKVSAEKLKADLLHYKDLSKVYSENLTLKQKEVNNLLKLKEGDDSLLQEISKKNFKLRTKIVTFSKLPFWKRFISSKNFVKYFSND